MTVIAIGVRNRTKTAGVITEAIPTKREPMTLEEMKKARDDAYTSYKTAAENLCEFSRDLIEDAIPEAMEGAKRILKCAVVPSLLRENWCDGDEPYYYISLDVPLSYDPKLDSKYLDWVLEQPFYQATFVIISLSWIGD